MKQIETLTDSAQCTAISVGKMAELGEHVLALGPDIKIPGKVFVGGALKTTGAEMSLQSFAPGTETGFVHKHKCHEEIYLFISGDGEFQVDGKSFAIAEGSIVRVAPEAKRTVRNTGDSPLVMACIQYRAGSFGADDATDGEILAEPVVW